MKKYLTKYTLLSQYTFNNIKYIATLKRSINLPDKNTVAVDDERILNSLYRKE